MINSIWTGLVDIVFPRNCVLCRAYHPATARDPLCPACRASLAWNTPPFCVRCSRHLETVSEESLCPSCRSHPPHFDEGWALVRYEGTAREILHKFKFQDKTSLRRTFTKLLKQFIARYDLHFPGGPLVIPIPLHMVRLKERGYNQAALFAAGVARELSLTLREDILERARFTPRQSKLGAKERWTNIQGAFRIKNPATIAGRAVILVDDVLTTAATASEAAKTLKGAGASRVDLITLAIAPCGSCAITS